MTECTVSDIAASVRNALVGGPFGSDLVSKDYVRAGVPVIRGTNLGHGRWVEGEFAYVTPQKADALASNCAKPGDIVFTQRGTLGQVALVPKNGADRYLISQSQMKLTVDAAKADPLFIYYVFTSAEQQEYIRQNAIQTGVPHTNLGILRNTPLTLPELPEQRAIAAVLGALDDKIELNRRMNATLEAMARALFQSWFVDFDPVRAKAEGRPPAGLDKPTAALFPAQFQPSELGEIPQGWSVAVLPDAIDFLEGPGLRNWQYRDEGMKFLNIRCIGNGDLDIAKANCISLGEFNKTYSHFALLEDDVVISTSGTLGRLAIVRDDHLPVMLNTSIIRMRGRGDVGLGYVWGFLQSEYFLAEMFAMAAGSVQLNFGPMHLRKISLLRPSDGVLKAFESAAQPLLRKCLHVRQESRTLATLRDTLLPKLLSGQLSVRETLKITEGC